MMHLLQMSNKGKLMHGDITRTAQFFGISPKTVARVWSRGIESLEAGKDCADVSARRKNACGRKGYDSAALLKKIEAVPLHRRTLCAHSQLRLVSVDPRCTD
ncbi:TPA: hypothetical protein N0F65_008862 [Lagenidium giganteum]|uniref:DUF7769 domain-containing protein n=1 Tax=Lagenidium giganteum TaxID=4803 RepID=A0AAV2YID6_9STRA|nr:TPA: hypothetical protein N0F65_008862 [Lagenidium giganteum]